MVEMGNCGLFLLLILFLSICISNVYSTEFVPVFMWESSSEMNARKEVPALATISADEFKDIVMQKLQKKPVVVIFAEENLSVEDFSWQDEAGEGAFPNLENISRASDGVTYLPFVHAPLRAFHHHLPMKGQDWYHLKLGPTGAPVDNVSANETLLFVNLDDATSDEDRPELLKRHDAVISQVYKLLTEHHDDVLAVYTAHHSSWQSGEETLTRRVRRLLSETDLEAAEEKVYASNKTLLYAPTMTLTVNGASYVLENGTAESEDELALNFNVDGKNFTVAFLFENTKSVGYWSLQSVSVTTPDAVVEFSSMNVYAPLEFSYHCGQEIFTSETNTLTFSDFQVQPFTGEKSFGSAYDCVYFFTVPIWSGLFVCTLFSLIMAFGLCMIMDIKTMDRFDDPKGKTITINTSE
ncbi:V-type proton ATPase subunit S1-like [Periplaneta americana]|uniref:V-type proton ATPase subunit S1-like n=1 Tax=Periplaneta americana TaxID=6978 RepID=UPI0037E9A6D5